MSKRTDLKRIMVIGSGPIIIGQACEFDYSGTQAVKALKEEGFEVIFNGLDWEYIKILSEEERKIQGLLALEEGEIIQENQVVKIEKPSEFYDWDFTNSVWVLNTEREKLANEQEELEQAAKDAEFLEMLEKWGGM